MHRFAYCLRKRAFGLAAIPLMWAAHAAMAQMPFTITWPGLTPDDLARMHAAGSRLYEGRSIGTVERWRSPDSKDAGQVTLVRSFESHGMPCRTLDYTIRFDSARNSPNRYIINWCKVEGDEWKIVEVPPPR
jgi:hypothetical protein